VAAPNRFARSRLGTAVRIVFASATASCTVPEGIWPIRNDAAYPVPSEASPHPPPNVRSTQEPVPELGAEELPSAESREPLICCNF
jgi:hypothetical protein